jgi:hypothetical protein
MDTGFKTTNKDMLDTDQDNSSFISLDKWQDEQQKTSKNSSAAGVENTPTGKGGINFSMLPLRLGNNQRS